MVAMTAPGRGDAEAAFDGKDWFWVRDGATFAKAWVVKQEDGTDGQMVLRSENGKEFRSKTTDRVNPARFDGVQDMASLTHLNEPSVANNLKLRYESGQVYTLSGLFLVAVNPYRTLPIYGKAAIDATRAQREDRPHIFATADQAYRNMLTSSNAQSILITGESGAGKTENTKRVIQYLTSVAPSTVPDLEARVLQANPILEAFGNAQTLRNDNSSRFGKFIRIHFSSTGAISGAKIDWFLLEKSRVTQRSAQERSYHVFYQLLAGASPELRQQIMLSDDYEYLKSRKTITGVSDKAGFQSLQESFAVMGVSSNDQRQIYKVLSAILMLGNVEVTSDRTDQARFPKLTQIEKLCHLLGVSPQDFAKVVLSPRVQAGREWITQARTTAQARATLSALSRALYERNFGALVSRINDSLSGGGSGETSIGVLDMAGFEIFEHNSFEQLCINFTNEKLQQFFNHHMFVLEQEEYAREEVRWDFIDFGLDLAPTIDLIEKVSPIGVLGCLDEECVFPKATDETFTEKMHQLAKGCDKYRPAKFPREGFVIKHYASEVEYKTAGWLEKNKDPLSVQLSALLQKSTEPYVAKLFDDSPAAGKSGLFRTVAQKHKEQLSVLMSQLAETQPHFVRCILPNGKKSSKDFDFPLVLDQLRCNGVLEGIRIARSGFPNRIHFADFRTRYAILVPAPPKGFVSGADAARRILQHLALDEDTYRVGLSKVFFRAGVLAELETKRESVLHGLISGVQAFARGRLARRLAKKRLLRRQAAAQLKQDFRACLALAESPWWQLFVTMKPLLSVTRTDRQAKMQNKELLMLEAAVREKDAALQKAAADTRKLESDSQGVVEQLAAARQAHADQHALLVRARERETVLEGDLAQARSDGTDLDARCEQMRLVKLDMEQQLNALRVELNAGVAMVQKLVGEKEADATKLKALEDRAVALKSSGELADKAKNVAEAKLSKLQVELTQHRTAMEEEQSSKKQIDQRLIDLKQTLESTRTGHSAAQESLRKEADTAKRQVDELAKSLSGAEERLRRKDDELAAIKQQLSTAKSAESQAKLEVTKVRTELESSALSTKALRQELDLEKSKTARLTAELAERQEAAKQSRELECVQSRLTEVQAEAETLRAKLGKADLSQHTDALKHKRDADKAQLEVRRLQVINGDLVKQMARARHDLQTLQNSDLRTENTKLRKELQETQGKLGGALMRMGSTRAADSAEAAALRVDVETGKNEMQQLQSELRRAREKLQQIHQMDEDLVASQVRELTEEKQTLSKTLADREEQCKQVLTAHATAIRSETRLQREVEDMHAEIEKQRKLATDSERRRSEVQQQLRGMQKQMLDLHDSPSIKPQLDDDPVTKLSIASPKLSGHWSPTRPSARDLAIPSRSRTNSIAQRFESPERRSPLPSPTRRFGFERESSSLLSSSSQTAHTVQQPLDLSARTDVDRLQKENRKLRDMLDAEVNRFGQFEKAQRAEDEVLQKLQVEARAELETVMGKLAADKLKVGKQMEQQKAALRDVEAQLASSKKRVIDLEHTLKQVRAETRHKPADESVQVLQEEIEDLLVQRDGEAERLKELKGSVDVHKKRADEYFGKLEQAEVTVLRATTAEQFAKKQWQETQTLLKTTEEARRQQDRVIGQMLMQAKDVQTKLEDKQTELDEATRHRNRLQKELDRLGETQTLDRGDQLRVAEETRQVYQRELEAVTVELKNERRAAVKLREENTRALNSLSKEQEERLTHIANLTKDKQRHHLQLEELKQSLSSASANHKASEDKVVSLLKEVNELRSTQDQLARQRDNLTREKRQLDDRIAEMNKALKTQPAPGGAGDAPSLKMQLTERDDALQAMRDRVTRAEMQTSEVGRRALQEREANLQLHKQKAALESEKKELQVRLIDAETRSRPDSQRNVALLQDRLREVEAELDEARKSRSLEVRSQRDVDRQLQTLEDALRREEGERERLEHAADHVHRQISALQQDLDVARDQESAMQLRARRAERDAVDHRERALRAEKELERLQSRFETSKLLARSNTLVNMGEDVTNLRTNWPSPTKRLR